MNLKDILSISGEPGLFRYIAQGKNAIIVEHLETKKRKTAFGSAKVSSLEDISIFTVKEDLPLGKIFDLIYEKENGGPTLDSKSDVSGLKSWFEEIVPEYDKDKVYTSDIKKVAVWYNLLQKLGLLIKETPEVEKDEEKETEQEVKKSSNAKAKASPKPKAKSAGKPGAKSASTISKGRPKSK
jgi:hypothetical protein